MRGLDVRLQPGESGAEGSQVLPYRAGPLHALRGQYIDVAGTRALFVCNFQGSAGHGALVPRTFTGDNSSLVDQDVLDHKARIYQFNRFLLLLDPMYSDLSR